MKSTHCADVDSTIWNTCARVRIERLACDVEALDTDRITTWTHVLDTQGEKTTTAIFDPERVRDREPYPGAPEVLRALQEKRDIEVHFVTHNDPEIMVPHLEPWLRTHFGPKVGLTVATEDKLGILDTLGAFGLIDDRPDTMKQPWDRDLVPNLLPLEYRMGRC